MKIMNCKVKALAPAAASDGTSRRCPDNSKICALAGRPKVLLVEGLKKTSVWYLANSERSIASEFAGVAHEV